MGREARIIIIDDDRPLRETLALMLEQEGYIVDTAENGKDAIEKTNRTLYHLAIVDWRLPDIEGTKLLGQLRETIPKMPKIMLTGYPSMNNAISAVNENADAFIVKPADCKALLETIEHLLKKRETEALFSEQKMASFLETRAKEIIESKKEEQTPSLKR
jgi:DNA-binding NtrC family response regulator